MKLPITILYIFAVYATTDLKEGWVLTGFSTCVKQSYLTLCTMGPQRSPEPLGNQFQMPHLILHNQRYVIQSPPFFCLSTCANAHLHFFCLFVVTVKFEIDEVPIFLHTPGMQFYEQEKKTKSKKSTHNILCIIYHHYHNFIWRKNF